MVIVEGVCVCVCVCVCVKIKNKPDRPTLSKTCYVTLNTHIYFFGLLSGNIFEEFHMGLGGKLVEKFDHIKQGFGYGKENATYKKSV